MIERDRGSEALEARTREFALRVIRLVASLPRGLSAHVIGRQLLRAATSVGANYRAACRARLRAEFIAKVGIVEEEIDPSIYWMELLIGANLVPEAKLSDLMAEADEIAAIRVASVRTVRRNSRKEG
jgi:four helix bundle protein